jgi:2,4-dienoyl-CoA reductase-like NADH-dependent reductase (Old Yellow Enzyme family)
MPSGGSPPSSPPKAPFRAYNWCTPAVRDPPDAPWPDTSRDSATWPTVGASSVPFGQLPTPAKLRVDEIDFIVAAFADAAHRAATAGFQVLELHGAHGYLIHQFLSPHSNTRSDQYGGTLNNRMRFALDVATAVRDRWPQQLPLFFRVSATDWLAGDTDDPRHGWTLADTIQFASRLKNVGVDLIDVSTGGSAPDAKIPVGPSYQVPFAAKVRAEADIATAAVGMITEADQAEAIVAGGQADAVFWRAFCCATRRGSAKPQAISASRSHTPRSTAAHSHAQREVLT